MALSDYLGKQKKTGRVNYYNKANGAGYSFGQEGPEETVLYNPDNGSKYVFGNNTVPAATIQGSASDTVSTPKVPEVDNTWRNPYADAYKTVSDKNNRAMEYYRKAVENASKAQETRLEGQKRNIYEGYDQNVKAMGRQQDAALKQLPENMSGLGLYGQGVGETAIANIKNQYAEQFGQLMRQRDANVYDIDNQIEALKKQAAADIYNYNAQMMAKDPELYLSILQQQVGQDNLQKQFDNQTERDKIGDARWEQQWKHQLDTEAKDDERWERQWQHSIDREEIEDMWRNIQWDRQISDADKKDAMSFVDACIEYGVMPSDEQLTNAGLSGSSDQIKQMVQKTLYQSAANFKLSGDATGNALVDGAKQYLGTPYLWGGTTPDGFDCSGLVQYVYKQNGINIPRTSQEQFKSGVSVSKDELQPGDLVFFKGSDGSTEAPGHVAMYIGNGEIIEAPSKGKNVRTIALSEKSGYVGARRYVKGGSSSNGSSSSGSSSGGSSGKMSSEDKEINKSNADAYVSHWIYSDLTADGQSMYTDKTTDSLEIVKMKLKQEARFIKDALINSGYTSAQADTKYNEYVKNAKNKYMSKKSYESKAKAEAAADKWWNN